MWFYGLLGHLTERWLLSAGEPASIQNDLLCGEGDIESTEPTKSLMRIAARIDAGDPRRRDRFLSLTAADAWRELEAGNRSDEILHLFEVISFFFDYIL